MQWSEAGFETVFIKHYQRVVTVLNGIVRDRMQAEELANEVFWRLYCEPLPAERRENLAGWLHRTAVCLGIDALRAATRRKRYEQEAARVMMELRLPADPAADLLRDEQCRRVRAALARMKPQSAQLLILRSRGLSYQELSQALDIKPTSVGTMLARAETEFAQRYRAMILPMSAAIAGAMIVLLAIVAAFWHCSNRIALPAVSRVAMVKSSFPQAVYPRSERAPVIAEKPVHIAHARISAGKPVAPVVHRYEMIAFQQRMLLQSQQYLAHRLGYLAVADNRSEVDQFASTQFFRAYRDDRQRDELPPLRAVQWRWQ